MGTHIKGPSRIASAKYKGKSLRDMFIDHPSLLGDRVYKTYGVQLPFLFKVLSVNKSLSIQAHPTKEHASILHSKYPERYPDPNHKPELAIGLQAYLQHLIQLSIDPFLSLKAYANDLTLV